MKTCGYCGRENVPDASNCRECGTFFDQEIVNLRPASSNSRIFEQAIQSVWTLRLGIVLAYLPLPVFIFTLLFSDYVIRHARLIPEEAWPVMVAIVSFLCFAGICLVPSIGLLLFHFRQSRSARWALVCGAIEALFILGYIIYINVDA